MELAIIVYLVMTVIPMTKFVSLLAFWLFVAYAGVMLFVGVLNKDMDGESGVFDFTVSKVLPKWKWFLPLFLMGCMIPNKETTWYMIAAYGTQKVVENPIAQDLAKDGVDVLKELMAKAKKELQEEAKESVK